jgi:hypothetical protein
LTAKALTKQLKSFSSLKAQPTKQATSWKRRSCLLSLRSLGWLLVLPAAPLAGMLGFILARKLAKKLP